MAQTSESIVRASTSSTSSASPVSSANDSETPSTGSKRTFKALTAAVEKEQERKKRRKRGVSEHADPLGPYKHIARWVGRAIDPHLSLQTAFMVGLAYDISAAEAEDTGEPLKTPDADPIQNMSEEERSSYRSMYKKVCALMPSFDQFMEQFVDDPATLTDLLGLMESISKQCRADDIGTLKDRILDIIETRALLDSDKEYWFTKKLDYQEKTARGFNSIVFGRLLCPHSHSAAFSEDPSAFCKRVYSAQSHIRLTAQAFPAFLYGGPYNEDNIEDGLLRGPVACDAFKCIFTSPSSITANGTEGTRGRASQAELHNMTRVTPQTIAYACMITRFVLSSARAWSAKDGDFNYWEFYHNILIIFDASADPDSEQWAAETLDWWDKEVFHKGPRRLEDSMIAAASVADRNSEFNKLISQRKARREARQANAAASFHARTQITGKGKMGHSQVSQTEDDIDNSENGDEHDNIDELE